jgi:hypothetical protein
MSLLRSILRRNVLQRTPTVLYALTRKGKLLTHHYTPFRYESEEQMGSTLTRNEIISGTQIQRTLITARKKGKTLTLDSLTLSKKKGITAGYKEAIRLLTLVEKRARKRNITTIRTGPTIIPPKIAAKYGYELVRTLKGKDTPLYTYKKKLE